MIKSAHPDVSFWSYERPSRGYFGYHLRARTKSARHALCQRLSTLGQGDAIVLRFGATLEDVIGARWTRSEYGFVTLSRSETPARSENLSIAVPEEGWPVLLHFLSQVDVHDEGSVDVIAQDAHVPLWVWWDAE
jgi:hypothetical protein